MNKQELFQAIFYFIVLFMCAPVVGGYIARVFSEHGGFKFLAPLERLFFRSVGIDPREEMHWTRYLSVLLLFNLCGLITLFGFQLLQAYLPLNPQHLPNVEFFLALNTAVSFVTNTNWQAYSGESTVSYCVQMAGLGVQNFLSAATGMAVMVALCRGLVRHHCATIGNFWSDIVKTTLYILLPLSLLLSIVLVSQGVVQTFAPYRTITTLSGAEQTIPLGPAASQIAIKQLGTNGGGFFGVNSSHPFENPTPLTNFLEMLSILLIPVAQVFAFGRLVAQRKHAVVLFTVMAFLLLSGFFISWYSEISSAHIFGVTQLMEGKEVRFGIVNSVLWETVTTAASNGSVNAMHDSLSPVSILVALLNMMLGEVVFGGVGSGLYGMILLVFLTVFLVGLMVGRTPEYLGKKIEGRQMWWTMAGILIPNLVILVGSTSALLLHHATAGILNPGPHGLSQITYAFTSAAVNNGSALAGLSVNTPFYNIALATSMLLGRFGVIIPVLAIAGGMGCKPASAEREGKFQTDTMLFGTVLLACILIVASLTFIPMLLLGPVVEHLLMLSGALF